ncbi:solute carrier family 12 member 4-like isoform X2 [Biomphalaria glabrata]|uniref:Solute carrier family 12 member 4-like isoform X2 n=1 Tax=Biomphalaria glabrata TaxID=6526 RepID=A0A9W3B075_BIOGL|nr:solute carrier family 12 member 4-like isoform X2 [Biomphalaria glabrata]
MDRAEEEREVLEPLNPPQPPEPAAITEVGGRFNVQKIEKADEPMILSKRPSVDNSSGANGEPAAKVVVESVNHDPDTIENIDEEFVDLEAGEGRQRNSGENAAQNKDNLPLADNEESMYNHMALYEDDLTHHGKLSQILNRITSYQAGITPNPNDIEKGTGKQKANLGTILGVYLPCIQNIFGVLLFVRLTWIVGMAGTLEAFCIVFICCSSTMLTAFSMSAIATNGVVPAGGSYFMISRSLGPEFGGAVGVLFYLGTSVASSMYIVGAVEILVQYMAPQMNQFGDVFNSYRLYGTVVLLLLAFIVFVGVGFVSKFAALSLACVIISILCIYIGIFVANPDTSLEVCMLGERLLEQDKVMFNGTFMCTKNITGPIYQHYCVDESNTSSSCDYFNNPHTDVKVLKAIPGLSSGIFSKNIWNKYTQQGKVIGTEQEGSETRGEIIADMTTSFMILIAIYFPSVTGIMAGSNRSGDLADAQKSIPIGTIAAICTTSSVYLSCVLFFAGCIDGNVMRDKYGASIGGSLIIGKLAWPHEWVILIGSFLSTLGAGLQSLTGAPRLLQAIAKDGVIPFLRVFSITTKRGEPFRALLLTTFISEIGVLIGNVDYIAPIITMFFLMCYGFVNMACALQTLLQTPNWRPRFRFYHWTLSLLGLALCIVLMFISSWYYALAALAIAFCIYKYIEYKGAEQEWGDGIRGLAMSAARYSLLRLQAGPPHTKNWRPQLLVLMKLDETLQPKFPKLVLFASQLKAGKGLVLVNSVLEGNFRDRYPDAQACKQTLHNLIKEYGVKGFCDVSVATDVSEGLCQLIQNAGLGGLKHNTVVLGWPYGWRHDEDDRSYRVFLDTVRNVGSAQMCLLVPKGINQFPDLGVKLKGTIDVWWIVHDGGLLMLLPFLLCQDRTWKNCKLRIFTVAQTEDNSIQMKKDLQTYLYQLRITADVDVVEMSNSDISAYTYERTLIMEQRTDMLSKIRNAHRNNANSSLAVPTITLSPVPEESSTDAPEPEQRSTDKSQYTFTPSEAKTLINKNKKPDKNNVRRMHTAVRLNEHIVEKSHSAQLVILNLPAPPKSDSGAENYMEFLEVLTEGIERVLMVRGSGREVITIYS